MLGKLLGDKRTTETRYHQAVVTDTLDNGLIVGLRMELSN